jgi:FKBP-type peptidyl-prolyl cis-trans isomerase
LSNFLPRCLGVKQDCNFNSIAYSPPSKTNSMKTITLAMIFSLGTCLMGCASQSKPVGTTSKPIAGQTQAGTNVFNGDKSRSSYAIGMMFGSRWKQQEMDVDYDWLLRGLKDAQAGGPTLLTEQEMGSTLNQLQKENYARQEKRRQEIAEKNKKDGEAFLAANKNKPGTVTLPDGLQYKIMTNGSGAMPVMNDAVTVNYRGTFIDGKEFDNSAKAGHPVQFTIGNVIRGWTEALLQMKVGSKWQLFVPSELAYGERGRPSIPPNSVLIFEIELVSAEHQSPPAASAPEVPLTSDIIKVPSAEEMKKGAKIEFIKPEDAAKFQQSQPQPSK